MNKEDFINVAEEMKDTVVDTANQVGDAAKEGAAQFKEAARDFVSTPVLPKVENYVNQQVKANPSTGATLLHIAGIADIVIAVLQFLMALILFFASSLLSGFISSFLGGGLHGIEGMDETSLFALDLFRSFGSAFVIAFAVLFLILGGLNLWFGIRAIRDRFVPGKNGFLMAAGIVQTILSLFFNFNAGFSWFQFVCLGVSVCYLVGAYLKRQADYTA